RRQDAGGPHVLVLGYAALPRRPKLPPASGQSAEERSCGNEPAGWTDVPRCRPRTRAEPARELRAVHPQRPGGVFTCRTEQRPGDPRSSAEERNRASERLRTGACALLHDDGLGG